MGLGALGRMPWLRELAVLTLFANEDAGPEAAARLAEATFASSIEALDLGWCLIGTEGLRRLLRPGLFPKLRRLSLQGNRLGDAGLSALLESPLVQQLSLLKLDNNELTDVGMDALARASLSNLSALSIEDNKFSRAGFERACGGSLPHPPKCEYAVDRRPRGTYTI